MRWHSVILIAGVVLVVESAKYSHEKKSHFTSVEDEEERGEREEREEREDSGNGHIFDVKKIVKGTIDAIGGQGTTPKPDDGLYQLLNIPSEILTQIASDAGYIEPSTTVAPKKKRKRRNHKPKKYRKMSEDGSYEGTYVRVEDEEDEEDDESYKPRKKNKSKRRHHRPIYLPPNYVPPPMVSSPPLQHSLPTHQIPQQQPPVGMNIQRQQLPQMEPLTSIFAPLPSFPLSQLPTVPLPTFAPMVPLIVPTTTTPVPPTMAPLNIRPVENVSPLADSSDSSLTPQYIYQPVIQADGKTYYHRALILAPIREGNPASEIVLPTVATTTQTPTTAKPVSNSFVTDEPTTTTEEPSSTEGPKRKTKIRRRLIKNKQTITESETLPAGAIKQLPQSDTPVVSTTMRPVAITFSPNLELFQTKAPSVDISLQEEKEVKIKPRTHGTRTHSVGKAIQSGTSTEGFTTNQPSLRYIKDDDEEESDESPSSSSSIPTPPTPNFTPKLITTQHPSIEQQMKNNEVFSVSLETAKKGSGTLSAPQVTALHSIANRRLQAEDDYLPPIEEKKRRKKTRKTKKERKDERERKEERVKKVERTEIEDIKEAVEAVRREKKEKVQRRFHQQEEEKKEEETREVEKEEEEEENETTTHKPKRKHHKQKRVIEVDTPKKISRASPEDETEESPIPPASVSSSSFRRSLAPALIDVRELGNDNHRTNSQSLRHVHHAERLAILRRSLEARARGVKQLNTQDKEEEEEEEKKELLHEGEESKSSTPLSDLFPSTTTEIARKKTRRHRKRKTTVAPSTTTTTTESPTTTAESEESYELNDEEYQEGDISFEIDENGDKIVKTTTTKPVRKTTTTTESPTTATSSNKLKVLRPHCLNIRSFSRQFGMVDVFDFVDEHCSFIENYYPSLTCDRREEYLAYCAGVWDSTKL